MPARVICRYVCVHFFHPEFETCKVMDKHLRICAAKPIALGTRFLRIEGAFRAWVRGRWWPRLQKRLTVGRRGLLGGQACIARQQRPKRAGSRTCRQLFRCVSRRSSLPPCPPAPCAAPKAAFFVTKLKIKVLPTLVFFHNGVATGRLTGFEGLRTIAPTGMLTAGSSSSSASGGSGASAASLAAGTDFETPSLLRMLKLSGVLGPKAEVEADSDDDGDVGAVGGTVSAAAALADARRKMLAALDAADD